MIRCLFALLLTFVVAPSGAYADTITFDMEVAGIPPNTFQSWGTGEAGPGRWAVVRDTTARAGSALEQFGAQPIKSRFPLAIYTAFSGDNLDVQIRFKTIAGNLERAAGVAFRLTTPDDYYVARASALDHTVHLYRVVGAKQELIAGINVRIAPNEWHTLRVRAQGERFTISFDGAQNFAVNDTTIRNAGKIALWTQADSVTRFADIEITALPKSE